MGKTIAAACALLLASSAAAQEPSLFDRLDANQDGAVTADEVDAQKRRLFDQLLREADANDDGRLSREEFTSGTTNRSRQNDAPNRPPQRGDQRSPRGPQTGEFLRQYDNDRDGKISREETPGRMRANFDTIDSNGDGGLDRAELERAFAAFSRQAAQRDNSPEARQAGESFERLDLNGDGKLTIDEIPQDRRDRFRQMLARFDDDGDGAVTKPQFIRALVLGGEPSAPNSRPNPQRRTPQSNDRRQPPVAQRQAPSGFNAAVAAIALLDALDRDRDGQLSAEEVSGASQALARLDRNGDGALNRGELTLQFGSRGGQPGDRRPGQPVGRPNFNFNPQQLVRGIMQADRDGDGKISKEEAAATDNRMLKFGFERFDLNGDGLLEREELTRAFARGRGQQSRPGDRRPARPQRPGSDRRPVD